jgi:integrase
MLLFDGIPSSSIVAGKHTQLERNRTVKHFMHEIDVRCLQERLQGHHLKALVMLALLTGMRRDELLHVTWSQVDLEKREIRVVNSKTRSNGRVISISEKMAQILRCHQISQMSQREEVQITSLSLDLVFPDDAGGVRSRQRFVEVWKALLDQVGLPHVCFHELRVLVWRRLLEQGREAHKECDGEQERSLDRDNSAHE